MEALNSYSFYLVNSFEIGPTPIKIKNKMGIHSKAEQVLRQSYFQQVIFPTQQEEYSIMPIPKSIAVRS